MDKSFEYRIYPNATQRAVIDRTFGCCRYVYNRTLAMRKDAYETGVKVPSINECITSIPIWKREDAPWLCEVDYTALQQSLRNLDKAYKNFFRAPGKIGFPRFKSKKDNRHTYRTQNSKGRKTVEVVDERHIKLPKLGKVKARISRMPEGRILSATIKRVPSGKYFCVLCCIEVAACPLPPVASRIGIDLGITSLVVTSEGKAYDGAGATKRFEGKLRREQRRLSRKVKGSANRGKQKIKVARIQEKIANVRKDYTHKMTKSLIDENQVIVAEDLNVRGMVQNRHLAKAISDGAFGEVCRQLAYKATFYGRSFIQVSPWYPSTKTCSSCGHIQDMPLSARTYRCPCCGVILDRDLNAARNILDEGMRVLNGTVGCTETGDHMVTNACGTGVSRPAA